MTAPASRRGLVEFAAAAVLLPAGVLLLERAGLRYMEPGSGLRLLAGLVPLALFAIAAFHIARRREYPWLLAIAAVALPLFDPTRAPYDAGFRVIVAVRDLVLAGAALLFIVQAVRAGDELERRVHLEALAWSYSLVVVLLLVYAMAADALPPLRATWVASGLLAGWVAAWLVTSRRYQR